MAFKKLSVTVTADASGDGEVDTGRTAGGPGYRSPLLVRRIDIDDSGASGSGSSSVTDEDDNSLAADDPTTYLWTTDDSAASAEHPGQLCEGPLTCTISGWDEDDVIVFTIFYEN